MSDETWMTLSLPHFYAFVSWSSSEFVILSLRNWEPIYDVETVVKVGAMAAVAF